MQKNEGAAQSGPSTEKPKKKRAPKAPKDNAAAVVKVEPNGNVETALQKQHEWPEARIKLLRDTIAKGASPDEFELAMQVVKRTGLDPFARQIYFIMRNQKVQENGQWIKKDVMSWQVSIDGFRLISQRSGKYKGMVGPMWCGPDGKWVDAWLEQGHPAAAKVGILHKDFSEPVWAVAKYSSYVVTNYEGYPNPMWKKMPEVMLAKCAEALARRAAFPQELSGLYTDDEMAQAKHGEPIAIPEATDHRAEALAKDVTPPKDGPQPVNPAQAAAMADDQARQADGMTSATATSGTTKPHVEKPETENKGIPSSGYKGAPSPAVIDAVRNEKILKKTTEWFKDDEGKEFKSRLTRLGYTTRTMMYEKYERCNCDLENFRSVIKDEWDKKQAEAAKAG